MFTSNQLITVMFVTQITQGLVSNGIEEKDIGIITPYNSQASLIRSICAESVEIHTIDKYQVCVNMVSGFIHFGKFMLITATTD